MWYFTVYIQASTPKWSIPWETEACSSSLKTFTAPSLGFSFIRVPTQAEVLGMFLFWELMLERGWGLRGNWRPGKKKDPTTRWQ